MNVLGVLDLMDGRAVHARGGVRAGYQPAVKQVGAGIPAGDAVALADSYLHELGATGLYVADLDAILGGRSQDGLISTLASVGSVWLDAGTRGVADAVHVLSLGVGRVVVGLETLPSYEALDDICQAVGGERVAFSLDLRHGAPLVAEGRPMSGQTPTDIARRATRSGATAVIVLDLARVGTGTGLDLELIGRVRTAAPDVLLIAGGGVRGPDDLAHLRDIGCDGALVASALLSGALRLRMDGDDVPSGPTARG